MQKEYTEQRGMDLERIYDGDHIKIIYKVKGQNLSGSGVVFKDFGEFYIDALPQTALEEFNSNKLNVVMDSPSLIWIEVTGDDYNGERP